MLPRPALPTRSAHAVGNAPPPRDPRPLGPTASAPMSPQAAVHADAMSGLPVLHDEDTAGDPATALLMSPFGSGDGLSAPAGRYGPAAAGIAAPSVQAAAPASSAALLPAGLPPPGAAQSAAAIPSMLASAAAPSGDDAVAERAKTLRLDRLASVVIGVGAVFAALAAHQANAWSTSSRSSYAEAALDLQASTEANIAGVPAAVLDGVLFAGGAGRSTAADPSASVELIPPEARPAFDWAAKNHATPFAFPDYRQLRFPGADEARKAGEKLLERGRHEGAVASRSTIALLVVVLSLVLAVAATQRPSVRFKLGLVAGSGLFLFVSFVQLLIGLFS